MSLYNIVFGLCPVGMGLLALLDLEPWKGVDRFGRYRDCYLRRIDGELRVHLLTRNGGAHGPGFSEVTAWLRAQPDFLRDYDEPFDKTFHTYEFRVNDRMRPSIEHMISADPECCIYADFGERWQTALRRQSEQPNHPESIRILAALKPKLESVVSMLRDTNTTTVALLDRDHPLNRE